MRVLIDALSTTNQSGRHVLHGHLRGMIAARPRELDVTVLYPGGCKEVPAGLGPCVRWMACPPGTRRWWFRHLWERASLRRIVAMESPDVVLIMSGTALPSLGVPQVSLAMNPWALVPGIAEAPLERIKAALQRRAYRRAVRTADGMAYLSAFMRDAYERNAGRSARRSAIVYSPVGDDVREFARRRHGISRRPGSLVCVSAMARHKGIETLVGTMREMRDRHGRYCRLRLVGGWPDPAYERRIRSQVRQLELDAQVEFAGHLSREDVLMSCAEAEVFVLLSRCESFGIPGLEAQALGTPVVCSSAGAMPEIYGQGALVVPVDDASVAAVTIMRVMDDAECWSRLSQSASSNACRFVADNAGRVLLGLLETTIREGAMRL